MLDYEIIARFFRENFHPEEITVTIASREDVEGYRITLTDNESKKQKEFLTGKTSTVDDMHDMAITAAKLFDLVWQPDKEKTA